MMARRDRGQAAVDTMPITLGVVAIVGILVYAEIESQLARVDTGGAVYLCNGFGGCNGLSPIELAGSLVLAVIGLGTIGFLIWGGRKAGGDS